MHRLRHIFFCLIFLYVFQEYKAQCNLTANILTAFNCTNSTGMASITPIGGTPPYTVTSSPPGINSLTVANLGITVYNVTITDANNCSYFPQIIYNNRNSPASIVFTSTNNIGQYMVSCKGDSDGSALALFNGGVNPLTYTWSNGSNSPFITNLSPGIYSVTILDHDGCIATNSVEIKEPQELSSALTNTSILCYGGTLTSVITSTGGTKPYTSYTVNTLAIASNTVFNLSAGIQTITVRDGKGCIKTSTILIPVSLASSVSIILDNSKTGICPGSTTAISPTVTGGDGVYTYNWQPNNLKTSSIVVENVTQPFYTLTVRDGCGIVPAVKIVTINLFPETRPFFRVTKPAGCEPFCTGFVNTTPKSTAVVWNFGDGLKEQKGDSTYHCYIKSGSYHLKISLNDSNSCFAYYTYNDVIKVSISPQANFSTEPSLITLNNSDNVFLKNTTVNAKEYEWQINGKSYSFNKNVNYAFTDTGCYVFKLIARNGNGCQTSAEKNICVYEGFNFYMPGSFSPNGDGLNDVLAPKGTGWLFTNYSFEVYNRWGKKIFEAQDVFKGWDGGVLENFGSSETTRSNGNDIYNWRVLVTDNQEKTHVYRGLVVLTK